MSVTVSGSIGGTEVEGRFGEVSHPLIHSWCFDSLSAAVKAGDRNSHVCKADAAG